MMQRSLIIKQMVLHKEDSLLHGNPLLADWVTDKIGDGWITDLSQIKKLEVYADDAKCQQEFMQIKYKNKVRLAKYIKRTQWY